jgi:hypothetical protein
MAVVLASVKIRRSPWDDTICRGVLTMSRQAAENRGISESNTAQWGLLSGGCAVWMVLMISRSRWCLVVDDGVVVVVAVYRCPAPNGGYYSPSLRQQQAASGLPCDARGKSEVNTSIRTGGEVYKRKLYAQPQFTRGRKPFESWRRPPKNWRVSEGKVSSGEASGCRGEADAPHRSW